MEHDLKVQPKGLVFYVVEVILKLPDSVPHRGSVAALHLCPTRDSRLHCKSSSVVQDLALELPDELGALGSRSDEAHFSQQDVEDLRELVHAGEPEYTTYTSNSEVVTVSPLGACQLSIAAHRP